MRPSTRAHFALLGLLVVTLGCGTPTLDGANLETSIAKVRKSVDKSRRADFDLAMKTVESASHGAIEGTKPFALDGMTAAAVFAEAEKIGWRRDLTWAERAIQDERQVVDARAYLDRLLVRGFASSHDDQGRVVASFEVENGLDTAVDSGWIRIDAPRPDGGLLGGEDIVDMRPRLRPGERRQVQILVTSEASRVLAEEPGATVRTRFTLAELGGTMIAQEPSPEALEKAKRRLADEERRRDELRAKLGG